MADERKFEEALARFSAALSSFEVAVSRAREAGRDHQSLRQEVSAMKEDRSRLAQELDEAKAQAQKLASVNTQASGRLDAAMNNIRAILGGV